MFLKFVFFIYLILAILLTILCLFGIDTPYNLILFLLIPIFLFIALYYVSIKYKWKNTITNTVSIFVFFVAFFVLMLVHTIYFLEHKVPVFLYKTELNFLKNYYSKEKFSHFPNEIPLSAQNYYFYVEHGWDNSVDLLYFDTDENYINSIRKKYKDKCKAYGTKSEIFSKYLYPHVQEAQNEDILCMFNLPSGDDRYLTGYLIGKNRIYFFYECW